MEKLGRSNDVPHDLKDHLIRFSATDAYQPYPIWEIADPDMWHSKYSDGEFFEDKIVIVGPSAPKLHDVIDNPVSSEIKGPVMHLNVLAATMDHEFLVDLFLQDERIEPGQELFQTCDLDWIGLRAGLQKRKGCGRLVVDALFAAAFTLGAQMFHHRAKEIAKGTRLFEIEIVQLRGHRFAYQPAVAD